MTESVNLSNRGTSLLSASVKAFRNTFHWEPTIAAVAPGRVNVIGEHVDYNGGWVLPAAIDLHTVMIARPRPDRRVRLQSTAYNEQVEFSLDAIPKDGDWTRYVCGVLAGLLERNYALCGFDAYIDSTIPVGGGLSSSAALEAATALLALRLADVSDQPDRMELARLCQKAEHIYAGVPCGIMDQAAVLNCQKGHLLLLDCQSETFQHAPFASDEWELMIINSKVAHELASGEYGKRRAACHEAASLLDHESLRAIDMDSLHEALQLPSLTEEMRRCVRHVITENDRTLRTVEAFAAGNFEAAGELLNVSHASLRDDYRVSCCELDFIAAHLSVRPEVAGCRMTGGGFGGSCVALVRSAAVALLTDSISFAYHEKFGIEPDIYTTAPKNGAVVLSLKS